MFRFFMRATKGAAIDGARVAGASVLAYTAYSAGSKCYDKFDKPNVNKSDKTEIEKPTSSTTQGPTLNN